MPFFKRYADEWREDDDIRLPTENNYLFVEAAHPSFERYTPEKKKKG